MNETPRHPMDAIREEAKAKHKKETVVLPDGVHLNDFVAYMPQHSYIFKPDGGMWPGSSVNARIHPIKPIGEDQAIPAAAWLDKNSPVEQMTWAPGEPQLIKGRLMAEGAWIDREGLTAFNLYRPPIAGKGNAAGAKRWIDLAHAIYPEDAGHVVEWLAHRAQRPQEKINHAIVLGGVPGIGKDTLLEPVKRAVGPWNFVETSPRQVSGRFNGFLKSVILRISEAHDTGDVNRYQFYEHLKCYIAAPPDTLRIDEKHLREYSVMNVTGIILTTNHKADGIFLPPDDRRHYVAWSPLDKSHLSPKEWTELWNWYESGGFGDVATYLRELDISAFNPKAPPKKTEAFWEIVDAGRTPEDAELDDLLDEMDNPDAFMTSKLVYTAGAREIGEWLRDRKNRRIIPKRLESCGYSPVRNDTAEDGMWKVDGKRQAIYARSSLSKRDQLKAASKLTNVSAVSAVSENPLHPTSTNIRHIHPKA
jgi:Family of unknown function (DUF5906)